MLLNILSPLLNHVMTVSIADTGIVLTTHTVVVNFTKCVIILPSPELMFGQYVYLSTGIDLHLCN